MATATWNVAATNSFTGAPLIFQTTYEQRYLRAAIKGICDRLPKRTLGVEFGAGYGRMTLVLEEFFGRAVGFEREQALVTAASSVPSRIEIFNVPTLSAVPLSDGQADFAFCCTVLQHMMDESTRDTLAEMRRVVGSGFILLIETSHPGFLDGKYGEGIFTKGRSVGEYEIMLAPWCSDFVRPRHIGSTSGEVWGSLMMFRSPDMMRGEMSDDAHWTSDELSRSYVR